MQAKLPDVNAVLVFYRTLANKLMAKGDWIGAGAALNNQNAVLPEDYRVDVDDSLYNKAMKTGTFYKCLKCDEEIPVQDIKFIDLLNSSMEELLHKEKYSKFWKCPKNGCYNINRKSKTEQIVEKRVEPFYLKVVWQAPRKQSGLATRFGFKQKFETWFYQYQKEIEHQIGNYRAEYRRENPDDDDTSGYNESGED